MSKIDESKLRTGLKDPPAPLVVPTPDEPQPDEQSLGYGAVTLPTGHRDFLWKVHSYTNDYIRFSDAKSGVVIGFAAATLGALYATGAFATIRATTPGDWSALDKTLLAAVAFLVAGALAAAWSMRPRLDDKQPRGFVFWESVRAHDSASEFHLAYSRQSEADLDAHLAEHLYALSTITSKKFYWSAWGVLCGMAGGLLAGIRILVG